MRAERKDINVQIGMRLQSARENNGYTQEVFAETLDVGVEHYRKVEYMDFSLKNCGYYTTNIGLTPNI